MRLLLGKYTHLSAGGAPEGEGESGDVEARIFGKGIGPPAVIEADARLSPDGRRQADGPIGGRRGAVDEGTVKSFETAAISAVEKSIGHWKLS